MSSFIMVGRGADWSRRLLTDVLPQAEHKPNIEAFLPRRTLQNHARCCCWSIGAATFVALYDLWKITFKCPRGK